MILFQRPIGRLLLASPILLLLALSSSSAPAQNQTVLPPVNSNGRVLGTPQNALTDFAAIYKILKIYRDAHGGQYPSGNSDVLNEIMATPLRYGYRNFPEGRAAFINPDFALSHPDISADRAQSVSPYIALYKRVDGSPVGSPKPAGSRDLLLYTDLYYYRNAVTFPDGGTSLNPVGFYVALWDDGTVEKVPFDLVQYAVGSDATSPYQLVFPGQVNTNFNTLTYAERYGEDAHPGKPVVSPAAPVQPQNDGDEAPAPPVDAGPRDAAPDNGGPEALLQLSRRLAVPTPYGIERDTLWQAFDPTYPTFKLADLQSVSAPLGLKTEVKSLSLTQLQENGASAVIAPRNSNRLVALLALDSDRALIMDNGQPQNIGITALGPNYAGEALVPSASLTQKAALVATDPVRSISLPSLDAEVPQTVTLHNIGAKPVTFALEYPYLGVTEATLPQTTLAPGESTTLSLKLKWRPALKTATQNVLVSLSTNDPAIPRLQLAFLLTPPKE